MANEERTKHEVLAESTLFSNLLMPELSMLSDLFTMHSYKPGDVVFAHGEVGDSLYVIAEGAVEVMAPNQKGEMHAIAQLASPQFFGEMSLLDKEVRSATIKAVKPTKLLKLSNENLHTFAKNYRNGFTWVVVNIAREMSSRLREANRRLAEKA